MKTILVAGFKGNTNSAKVLLDNLNYSNKLYLENDFKISENQLETELINDYDYILMFGQKPLIKSIYIETVGRNGNEIHNTNFDYKELEKILSNNKYKTNISSSAGNYLCNNIYFYGLEYVSKKEMKTKIIFIHIPYLENIIDINTLSKAFDEYINTLK